MTNLEIVNLFKTYQNQSILKYNEVMANHTTFKVGGAVPVMALPTSTEELRDVLSFINSNQIKYVILGNGSNVIVRDSGIDYMVVKLAENFSKVEIQKEDDSYLVTCQSGVLLTSISQSVYKESLTGFEFASGIPGTLGGAVFMNAGAYGGEMKDVVVWVDLLTKDNQVVRMQGDEMAFGYRTSRVKTDGSIVLKACLKLKKGDKQDIKSLIDELTEKRTSKQPLTMPSAGSTFKRPEGYYAGKLIEDSGLRGFRYKSVGVSEKHCGFVVNHGEGTCEELLTIIETIQKIVFDKFGVHLEREVRILGEE